EEVRGWAFGLTDRARTPRPVARAVREVLRQVPALPLERFPRASVVVATYDGAATLAETPGSLEAQRYPDFEVIDVDDGHKDASAAIARRFRSVRLLSQENLGLSAARNRGIEA